MKDANNSTHKEMYIKPHLLKSDFGDVKMIILRNVLPKGAKSIALSNGGRAIVDAADFEAVNRHIWHWVYKSGQYYICGYPIPGGRRVYLHQFLMGDPPVQGLVIDHKNHAPWDCRRANLRWATARQNNLNSTRVGACNLFGVSMTASGKYQAYALGRTRGSYDTREEAGMVRDRVLRERLCSEDQAFVNFNYTPDGEPVVIIQYAHGIPPRVPRVKSTPFHGVSLIGFDKAGNPIYVANAMIASRKFRPVRYRNGVQAARHVDEIFQAHGLPRPNFKDVAPIVITFGVSYEIKN